MRALVAPLYLVAVERARAAREPRADDVRLPEGPRQRRPHVLRAVRRGGAARRAGLGLQRLRRRADLGGGAPATACARRSRSPCRPPRGRSPWPGSRSPRRFALLAIVPLRSFREFAFVMAAGVLVDTFVVRSMLVPGPDVAVRRGGLVARASGCAAARTRTTSIERVARAGRVGPTRGRSARPRRDAVHARRAHHAQREPRCSPRASRATSPATSARPRAVARALPARRVRRADAPSARASRRHEARVHARAVLTTLEDTTPTTSRTSARSSPTTTRRSSPRPPARPARHPSRRRRSAARRTAPARAAAERAVPGRAAAADGHRDAEPRVRREAEASAATDRSARRG